MHSRPIFVSLLSVLLLSTTTTAKFEHEHFRYDTPHEAIQTHVLDNPNYYDADIADAGDDLALTWLEFVPGEGDRLCLGKWSDGQIVKASAEETVLPGLARPTITRLDAQDRFTCVVEQQLAGHSWRIATLPTLALDELITQRQSLKIISPPSTLSINHQIANSGSGDTWMVWQQDQDGQFDLAVKQSSSGSDVKSTVLNSPRHNEWQPDVAAASDGMACVVYDAYDGDSYNVHAWLSKERKTVTLAASPAFEGRARVAADRKGRFWVVWEEGATNWGKRYITRMRLKSKDYFEITDDNGPLHRFRRLRMAVIEPDGTVKQLKEPLPMPSFDLAAQRENSPEGSKQLGVFYERAAIAVDASDKVWVVYRHYYIPYLGAEWITHNQSPWAIYARCLTANGWSKLYRFNVGQGDGMQRLEITPHGQHGIAAVWTVGRTHREGRAETDPTRGIAVATVALEGNPPGDDLLTESTGHEQFDKLSKSPDPAPSKAVAGDKEYELVFGDLHRHTDLSLCSVPADGTMDDHYRYAIDVVQHDFLAITDHARDIANGDARSLLWWRCTKEVSRHDLGSRFIPFSAYERSRGGEDHNVISLGIAPLRPFTYPHPDFWKELDDNTITIPHQTGAAPIVDPNDAPQSITTNSWEVRDDIHRPLIEVYQSCRDRWIGHDAHAGLRKGNHLGFIASSDHLATSSSYACIWTTERSREAVFQAMRDRRTFAATDKIRLILRAGDHWMGEQFEAPAMPRIDLEVDGTAPLTSIEVFVDGKSEQKLPQSRQKAKLTYQPLITEPGEHWVYVRAIQEDGNQAWSSPLFVTIKK